MSLCGALPFQQGSLILIPHSAHSGPLLPGGLHPDDYLGQGQTPQLPEGVPRLPAPAHAHYSLPALSSSSRLCPVILSTPHCPCPDVAGHGSPAATIKPAYPTDCVFFRGTGTTPFLPILEVAQMKFRQVTQSFYFTDRSTGWRGIPTGPPQGPPLLLPGLGLPVLPSVPFASSFGAVAAHVQTPSCVSRNCGQNIEGLSAIGFVLSLFQPPGSPC